MRAGRVRALVGVAGTTILLAGCGGDGESSAPTTLAATTTTLSQVELDRATAQRVVLGAADLPGFTEVAADPGEEEALDATAAVQEDCFQNNALLVRLGEEGDERGAASPDFEKGDLTVGSAVTFGETEVAAQSALAELGTASFPDCFSRAVADAIRSDPTLTNVNVTTNRVPAPTAGDEAIGFRSRFGITYSGTRTVVYLDYVFVRSGRAVAALHGANAGEPFPEGERQRLVQVLAGRMAAG